MHRGKSHESFTYKGLCFLSQLMAPHQLQEVMNFREWKKSTVSLVAERQCSNMASFSVLRLCLLTQTAAPSNWPYVERLVWISDQGEKSTFYTAIIWTLAWEQSPFNSVEFVFEETCLGLCSSCPGCYCVCCCFNNVFSNILHLHWNCRGETDITLLLLRVNAKNTFLQCKQLLCSTPLNLNNCIGMYVSVAKNWLGLHIFYFYFCPHCRCYSYICILLYFKGA